MTECTNSDCWYYGAHHARPHRVKGTGTPPPLTEAVTLWDRLQSTDPVVRDQLLQGWADRDTTIAERIKTQAVVDAISELAQSQDAAAEAATSSRDFGRGYKQAMRDVLAIVGAVAS